MHTTNTQPPTKLMYLNLYIIEDIEIWANDYKQAIEIYNLTKY